MKNTESSIAAPRIVIAGLSGDSGKTVVAVGLLLAARKRGLPVLGFKKGPDYIDAAWLRWATGQPARNLDTFLMGAEGARAHFVEHAIGGLNVIEGNRGLFDGTDAAGTHSTAALAKTLGAPVVIVLDSTKVTRTAAALVLGCQTFDPDLHIAGVVLNRVAGSRHERVLREAIEATCSVPVLGVLPKIGCEELIPSRHLGLVPPQEMKSELVSRVAGSSDCTMREIPSDFVSRKIEECVGDHLDLDRILDIARKVSPLHVLSPISCCDGGEVSASSAMSDFAASRLRPDNTETGLVGTGLRIGYVHDSAFSFYYPENLEALESSGACLVPVSSLADNALPDNLNALYIGGGFPETHGPRIAANDSFLHSLKQAADRGLPIYAECGGLMLLARGIKWRDTYSQMSGVLPFDVDVQDKPQGHGYTTMVVDRENAFFPCGTTLRGHEFHYSKVIALADGNAKALPDHTVCAITRGTGAGGGRDAFVVNNVWASYTHLHAGATREWITGLIGAARRHRRL